MSKIKQIIVVLDDGRKFEPTEAPSDGTCKGCDLINECPTGVEWCSSLMMNKILKEINQ